MVAAMIALALAGSGPGPVAAFAAPTVVRVGQGVSYVDESYDPAPGHHITLEIWIGRASSFSTPGTYGVTLVVRDDRGLMASAAHAIVVVGSAPPPPPPPPQTQASIALSPGTVRRGDAFTVLVHGAPDAEAVRLILPAALRGTVRLPTGTLDYGAINRGAFAPQGNGLATTVWVPWTSDRPEDGVYTVEVVVEVGGQQETLDAELTVRGTDVLAVWRRL